MSVLNFLNISSASFKLQLYPLAGVFLLLGVIGLALLTHRPARSAKTPPSIDDDYPILGALRFWTARWEFFDRAQAQSPSGNFSFFIGHRPVVGIGTDAAKKIYFESKQLGFTEGFDSHCHLHFQQPQHFIDHLT
jgi:hypothetical protein